MADVAAVLTRPILESRRRTRRQVVLPVFRVLFLLGLIILLSSPLWSIRPQLPATVGPMAQVDLPAGGSAAVPAAWTWTSSPGYEHAVLALAASNKPEAVEDLVVSTPSRLSVRGVRLDSLTRGDAFVQVWSSYMARIAAGSNRLPRTFEVNSAQRERMLMGAPVLVWSGYGPDRNAHHVVTLWIGPNATPTVDAQATALLANLRLPVR